MISPANSGSRPGEPAVTTPPRDPLFARRLATKMLGAMAVSLNEPAGSLDLSAGIGSEFEWVDLIEVANRARMLPLLIEGMRRHFPDLYNSDDLSRVRDYGRDHKERTAARIERFAIVVALLRSAGIEPIVLKGPCLSQLAYGNWSLREFRDLDLLVRADDFVPAIERLCAFGFEVLSQQPNAASLMGEVREGSISIDLHMSLMPSHLPNPDNMEAFWSRLQEVTLADQKLVTLSTEDTVIVTAMHLIKEFHNRAFFLRYAIDLASFLHRASDMEKTALMAHAKALNVAAYTIPAFGLTMRLLEDNGAASPRSRSRDHGSWLADRMYRDLGVTSLVAGGGGFKAYGFTALRIRRALSCGFGDWSARELRSAKRRLFFVSPLDRNGVPIPDRRRGLQIILRPVRQIARQVRTLSVHLRR